MKLLDREKVNNKSINILIFNILLHSRNYMTLCYALMNLSKSHIYISKKRKLQNVNFIIIREKR